MDFDRKFIFITVIIFLDVFISSFLLLVSGTRAAILGALLVPCLFASYRYPRWGLLAFLTYLPFSGTIAYSIAGVFQTVGTVGERISYTADYPIFHLAKDAFYFPALLGILIGSHSLQKLLTKIKPLVIVLSILLGISLLAFLLVNFPQQLTVERGSPLLMGIVGLKILLGYIPLILCAYYFIRDRRDLYLLNRWLVILILICTSLCLIQYALLASGVCRWSRELPEAASWKASLQARCFVGGSLLFRPNLGLIRLPGTFVSPWQWAWFLIASSFLACGVSLGDPCRRWRAIGWGAMAAVLAATVVSGQKTSLLLVPLIFSLLLLLAAKRSQRLFYRWLLAAALAFVLASQLPAVERQIQGLVARWQYTPPHYFLSNQLGWIANYRLTWLGHGLGTASSAARRLGQVQLIETFYVKVLYEVGVLGFLAFLGVVTVLTVLTFRAYRSLQEPHLRHLGRCLWLFILFISYNPFYYPLAVDPVAVYYWFLAGILLKLPELDRQFTPQESSSTIKT